MCCVLRGRGWETGGLGMLGSFLCSFGRGRERRGGWRRSRLFGGFRSADRRWKPFRLLLKLVDVCICL